MVSLYSEECSAAGKARNAWILCYLTVGGVCTQSEYNTNVKTKYKNRKYIYICYP